MNILIADSGATKCEWCLLHNGRQKKLDTQGISPYFLDEAGIVKVIEDELRPSIARWQVDAVYYYGTGCKDPDNRKVVQRAIRRVFSGADVHVTDLVLDIEKRSVLDAQRIHRNLPRRLSV